MTLQGHFFLNSFSFSLFLLLTDLFLCLDLPHLSFFLYCTTHNTNMHAPPQDLFLYSLVLCLYFIRTCVFVLMSCIFPVCLYLQHTTQTFKAPAGFETATPAHDWPETLGHWDRQDSNHGPSSPKPSSYTE